MQKILRSWSTHQWLKQGTERQRFPTGKYLLTYREKIGQEKKEKGVKKKENWKGEGEKFEMEGGKVTNEERTFFFFFCFVFFLFFVCLFVCFCFVLFCFVLFCFCFLFFIFVFWFCFVFHFLKWLKFVLDIPKWKFSTGKKHFTPGKKSGKKALPPEEKYLLRPCHAFVTSRLDNCNSILYGLPDKELNKLQRIQNAAARLVSLTKKRDHITPVLFQLHWLPVRQRINFKLLLLTFKTWKGQSPAYISDLVTVYQPQRTLRTASQYLLQESIGRTITYGRSFSWVAPRLLDRLPLALRSPQAISRFKAQLKTHLFRIA